MLFEKFPKKIINSLIINILKFYLGNFRKNEFFFCGIQKNDKKWMEPIPLSGLLLEF